MNEIVTTAPIRDFSRLIAEVEDGGLHKDITDAVREIIAAVTSADASRGRGATGRLTINLSFTADNGIIDVSGDLKTVLPKKVRGRSVFFVSPENHLTRQDPRQNTLPLRDVTASSGAAVRNALA